MVVSPIVRLHVVDPNTGEPIPNLMMQGVALDATAQAHVSCVPALCCVCLSTHARAHQCMSMPSAAAVPAGCLRARLLMEVCARQHVHVSMRASYDWCMCGRPKRTQVHVTACAKRI